MITVLFFAQTRELVGVDSVTVDADNISASELCQQLVSEHPEWKKALGNEKLLIAINQTMSTMTSTIKNGDEVAFFPPVSGG